MKDLKIINRSRHALICYWSGLTRSEKIEFATESRLFRNIKDIAAKDEDEFIRMLAILANPKEYSVENEKSPLVRAAYFSSKNNNLMTGIEQASHAERILIISLKESLFGLTAFVNFVKKSYDEKKLDDVQVVDLFTTLAENYDLMREFERFDLKIPEMPGFDRWIVSEKFKELWRILILFPASIATRLAYIFPLGNSFIQDIPDDVMDIEYIAEILVDIGYPPQIEHIKCNQNKFSSELVKKSSGL